MTCLTPCCIIFRDRQARPALDVLTPKVLVRPNRRVLDPYVSHLRLLGQQGDLFLVDLESRMILVRRQVA